MLALILALVAFAFFAVSYQGIAYSTRQPAEEPDTASVVTSDGSAALGRP